MSAAHNFAPDMNKLNAFIGQFVSDLGAAVHAGMIMDGSPGMRPRHRCELETTAAHTWGKIQKPIYGPPAHRPR